MIRNNPDLIGAIDHAEHEVAGLRGILAEGVDESAMDKAEEVMAAVEAIRKVAGQDLLEAPGVHIDFNIAIDKRTPHEPMALTEADIGEPVMLVGDYTVGPVPSCTDRMFGQLMDIKRDGESPKAVVRVRGVCRFRLAEHNRPAVGRSVGVSTSKAQDGEAARLGGFSKPTGRGTVLGFDGDFVTVLL